MSQVFNILAEGGPKTMWDPTILGILVVLSGLVLFCGSTYLLLATNLGARLGFMVAASALAGIMVLLSAFWLTTQTPLTSPKGRTPLWIPINCPASNPKCAVVDTLAEATIAKISGIPRSGRAAIKPDRFQGQRSAAEAALVKKKVVGEGEKTEQPYAIFETGGQLITAAPQDSVGVPNKNGVETLKEYIIGGDSPLLVKHNPQYAAVEFCFKRLQPSDGGFDPAFPNGNPNVKPTTPGCDPNRAHKWLLLQYDYGSIRLPPLMYLLFSSTLFAVSLYALHSRELAHRRIAAAGGTLATV